MFERERTRPYIIRYALYLYFLGLSFGDTSKAIQSFTDRNYVAIWDWVQRVDPKRIHPFKNKKRIVAFLIDETQIQIGSTEAWLWVAIEPLHRSITVPS
jgi:transposase-like protein